MTLRPMLRHESFEVENRDYSARLASKLFMLYWDFDPAHY